MKVCKTIAALLIFAIVVINFCPVTNAISSGIFGLEIKVIDQNGNPIPNADVEWKFKGIDEYHIDESREQTITVTGQTDSTGTYTSGRGIKQYSEIHSGEIVIKNVTEDIIVKYTQQVDTNGNLTGLTFTEGNSYVDNVAIDKTKANIIIKIDFQEEAKCKVEKTNIDNIGDVVQIISYSKSNTTSMTVAEIVKYYEKLAQKDAQFKQYYGTSPVSWVKDGDEFLDKTSDKLIGTGMIICLGNDSHKVIVYGDMSGDGLVDAADINIAINYFLGNNTNITLEQKEAGDLQKDDQINAADMAIMINSFLGTLDGDILKYDNAPEKSISEIKEGEYILYKDASGVERKCIVLYNNDEFGIQAVTEEPVENLKLVVGEPSTDEWLQWQRSNGYSAGRDAYNSAIQTLNSATQQYLNSQQAISARCLGSVPNDPTSENTDIYIPDTNLPQDVQQYCTNFKMEDENYITDIQKLKELNIGFSNRVWLASRHIGQGTSDNAAYVYFDIRSYEKNGEIESGMTAIVTNHNEDKPGVVISFQTGLHPVFTLKSDLKIKGIGSKELPWRIVEPNN